MTRPRSLFVAAATAASLLALAPSVAQAQGSAAGPARPEVHIVATGGTIASTNYYGGESGKIGVEALLRAVPALDTVARVSAQQFSNVGSGAFTPAMWLALSRGIADTLRARPSLAGIVVTHGTDTMEETAYFLDLTVADARPVVVTGAMRPADGVGIDGPANLMHAARVAADPAARGRGAMILMNDEVLAARDATTANTARPDAFVAPVRGALGVADPEGVVWHRAPTRAPHCDLAGVRELPRGDVVCARGDADGAAVDALVAAGARGLVVAGVGRGGLASAQRDAINRAIARGVVVVMGSRTGAGSVPVGRGVRRAPGAAADAPEVASTVGAGDLNVQKARVLLMLALTRTQDVREVARIFGEHQ